MAEAPPATGGTVVVGGCGFLGYHLVRHLLWDAAFLPLHVVDIDTARNRVEGATYEQCHITDSDGVHSLLQRLRPRVVFHLASPRASLPVRRHGEFTETNVEGTRTLLDAARAAGVTVLLYTSTVDVYADPPHDQLGEDAPLWTDTAARSSRSSATVTAYCRTKAVADSMVRAANGIALRTAVLRPGHIYGERHTQGLDEILDAARGRRPLVQLRTDALMDVSSADNVAAGHVLAARALLDDERTDDVAGQAFNLSDGAPVPFWHHVRVIWRVARGAEAVRQAWTLPPWVMQAVVAVAEWSVWAVSLGRSAPPTALTSASLSYCTNSHTYSIAKARRLLGYEPVTQHDEVLAESVRWELRRRGEPVLG